MQEWYSDDRTRDNFFLVDKSIPQNSHTTRETSASTELTRSRSQPTSLASDWKKRFRRSRQ
jgi:hypothetical protein